MRGEQGYRNAANARRRGSSPHAWGTEVFCIVNKENTRFIPTCVGNSNALAVVFL